MMGRQSTKRELFVSVSLDEYVPEDHLLRAVSFPPGQGVMLGRPDDIGQEQMLEN
jgi:hypothetical protein